MNLPHRRIVHRVTASLLVAVALSCYFAVQTLRVSTPTLLVGALVGIPIGVLAGRLEIKQMQTKLRANRYVEHRKRLLKLAALIGGLGVLGTTILVQLDLKVSALSAYLGFPSSIAFATMLVVVIVWLRRRERRDGPIYVDVIGSEPADGPQNE